MKKTILFVSILALAGVAVLLGRNVLPAPQEEPSTAGPNITWSVPEISEALFPGNTKTVDISFRSDRDLADVAVWVAPSLQEMVSTNPAIFSSVQANREHELAVTVFAPLTDQERSFGGTIQLSDPGRRARTFGKPLTVGISILVAMPTPPGFEEYNNTELGLSFSHPSRMAVTSDRENVSLFSTSAIEDVVPAYHFILGPELPTGLEYYEGTRRASQEILGQDFASIDRALSKGALVKTTDLYAIQFILYDSSTGRTLIILASPDLYLSSEFEAMISTLIVY